MFWPKTGEATVSAILRSIEPLVPEVRLLVIVSTWKEPELPVHVVDAVPPRQIVQPGWAREVLARDSLLTPGAASRGRFSGTAEPGENTVDGSPGLIWALREGSCATTSYPLPCAEPLSD